MYKERGGDVGERATMRCKVVCKGGVKGWEHNGEGGDSTQIAVL